MLPIVKRVSQAVVWLAMLSLLAGTMRPAAACEVVLPPNYVYEEGYSFDERHFPPGLAVNLTRPQWVEDESLVGFVQLINQGTADIYLLFAFELGNTVDTLADGQQIDSSIWSRGLALRPGDTFDILGEGNMMQFAPGMRPSNVNNPDGSARPPVLDPLPTQSGRLYFVANQRLSIVPFTLTYSHNPAYMPDGTFKQYTLAQKVDSAPLIALGVALEEAGYDSRASTTVRVERWLKGMGGEEIVVGGFGQTSCDYQIEAGARRVFFLAPEGTGYRLNEFQAGMFDAMTWPEDAGKVGALAGQASPEPATAPDPPVTSWFWLAGGPMLLVFIGGSAFVWRRHRAGGEA